MSAEVAVPAIAWNPEIDPWIPQRYGPDSVDDKYINKRALRERFMLREDYKPIVAYIGRLDGQKGVHLIHHALFYALAEGAQFVLLGSTPDPAVSDHFWHLKHHVTTIPTSTSSCTSIPSSLTWCTRGRTSW